MKGIIYILLLLTLPVACTAQWSAIVGAISTVNAPSGPAVVPSFITNYYDAREESSLTKDGSNVVSQWNDLRGSNHLTQTTAGQRPTWNGSNGVFFSWSGFSSADDYMNGLVPGGPVALPVTFYVVMSANGTGNGNGLMRNIGGGQGMMTHNATAGNIQGFLGSAGIVSYTTNTQVCVAVTFNAATSTISINGSSPVTFGISINTSVTDVAIGWTGAGPGWTCNAIYVTFKVPTSTENDDMEAYINGEWAINF